ncbi:6-phosphogluconolactonase [Phenylobacterium sp.]|uniref:6-phosphogluconolactonase n=1 Tax=Phenylobacterium sp. TaxID=1871053 RepID=UPI0019AD363C|nr:6-phosphogluconolactonase [Phenylobacterium sp.]MBC7166998.1 6-phosphogluconolactonase [Phenylobacterium sp.]
MIESFDDGAAMAAAAAAATRAALAAALAAGRRASLVATGGRSPGPVYDLLSGTSLDWSRVDVTLSDERFVPADHAASNEGLVRERLLRGPAAAARFVPLYRPAPDPDAAARAAEASVEALAPFDMTLLGMGPDGHIASLIPGSSRLAEGLDPTLTKMLMGVPEAIGDPPLPRITLTLHALLQSRAILVLITGETKRRVIERAAAGEDLPVRALLTQAEAPVRVLWAP